MADHPLARQAQSAALSVQAPTFPPLPKLEPLVRDMGLMKGLQVFDGQMQDWLAECNDSQNRYFTAIKNNST
jgi:hypothetical protein